MKTLFHMKLGHGDPMSFMIDTPCLIVTKIDAINTQHFSEVLKVLLVQVLYTALFGCRGYAILNRGSLQLAAHPQQDNWLKDVPID